MQNNKTAHSRRSMLKYAVLGLGAGFLGTGIYLVMRDQKPLEQKVLTPFGQAKQKESFRQQYLDNIFANKDKYGVPSWDSFACFVYDPVFERMEAEFKRRGIKKQKEPVAGYSPDEGSEDGNLRGKSGF